MRKGCLYKYIMVITFPFLLAMRSSGELYLTDYQQGRDIEISGSIIKIKIKNQNQAIIYREDVMFSIAGHAKSGIPVAAFFEIKLVSKPRHIILDDSPTVRILAIKVSKTRTLYAYSTDKVEQLTYFRLYTHLDF